ncbi:MAG TPA: tetratricopeptide repeat protein [Chroococcidiopsis sp.]
MALEVKFGVPGLPYFGMHMHEPFADPDTGFTVSTDAASWYERGVALADSEHHREALACFERTLALCPDHIGAWVFRGVELIHLDQFEEALNSCDQALRLNPKEQEAWTFRGVALHRLGRFREAYASYDRALGLRRQGVGQRWLQGLKRFFKLFAVNRQSC